MSHDTFFRLLLLTLSLLLHFQLSWSASGARAVLRAELSPGACLEGQLSLARAGRFRAASQTPHVGHSARPLALIIPVYPPVFGHAFETLLAASGTPTPGWDLFFIFSNANHSSAWDLFVRTRRPDLLNAYRGLDISANAQVTVWLEGYRAGGSVAPYKQFHAMALLGACYEFLVVMDDELEWVNPAGLISAARRRATDGRVYAGWAPRFRGINVVSTSFFTDADKLVLEDKMIDFNLYSWWSDVPVMLGRDMAAFLQYAGYPDRRLVVSRLLFVGTLPYELWKVAQGQWTLVDLSREIGYAHCGSLETLGSEVYYERLRSKYPPGPGWLNKAFCLRYPLLCQSNKDLVVLFHTDRGEWALDLAEKQDCQNDGVLNNAPALCPIVVGCDMTAGLMPPVQEA